MGGGELGGGKNQLMAREITWERRYTAKPLSGMVKTVTEAQDFVPSLGRRRVSPQILIVWELAAWPESFLSLG